MKSNRYLKAAGALWLVTMVTTALLPVTAAKYTATATVMAQGRVAAWSVRLDSDDVPVDPLVIPGIPANATEDGHPLILFFKGLEANGSPTTGDASFTVMFINDSEVAARFTPKIEVDFPTDAAALAVVEDNISFWVDDPANPGDSLDITEDGIVLEPEGEIEVAVIIQSCTFAGLKIGALCVQVD